MASVKLKFRVSSLPEKAGTRLSIFSLRLMEVLSRSMVTPFLSCTTLPKMSEDNHSPKSPSYLLIANDPEMESIIGALNALLHTHLTIIRFNKYVIKWHQ